MPPHMPPQTTETFEKASENARAAPGLPGTDLLCALAPIITADNGAADDFLRTIFETPHEQIGHAQADALRPVWDALAAADPGLREMDGASRPDIPMTADGLHKLSCDVTKYLSVAQMQMPMIIPNNMRLSTHLDNRIMETEAFLDNNMEAFLKFVQGAETELSYVSGPSSHRRRGYTRFGFAVVQKEEQHSTGNGTVALPKIIAVPVITVDDIVLEHTLAHGGEPVLRHLQMIAGLFNHDYFHHFTARIINPYFGMNNIGGFDIHKTPYGILMGVTGSTHAGYKDSMSFGMEQTVKFNIEKYKQNDPLWTAFNSRSPYEFHAMHLHNVLYRDHMDAGPVGAALREHVAGYMDEVADLAHRMTAAGAADNDVQSLKLYYANMMAFHLLRLVPFGHPVMAAFEEKVDALYIDPAMCHLNLDRAIKDTRGSSLERLVERTGIDLSGRRDRALSPAESVRACAFFAAERVLNPMYNSRYEEPRSYALAAMRQSISVVWRDLKIVELRGGVDGACRYLSENHSHAAPPSSGPGV